MIVSMTVFDLLGFSSAACLKGSTFEIDGEFQADISGVSLPTTIFQKLSSRHRSISHTLPFFKCPNHFLPIQHNNPCGSWGRKGVYRIWVFFSQTPATLLSQWG